MNWIVALRNLLVDLIMQSCAYAVFFVTSTVYLTYLVSLELIVPARRDLGEDDST